MTSKKPSSFLQTMIQESDAYSTMAMIESLIEQGMGLENVPLQPLYTALKSLPSEQVTQYLDKLSKEQRTILLDLDLWQRDDIDPNEFQFWLPAYAACSNESVRSEFVKGTSFGLYLKGRFNIWTFDVEDPQYPEHDNYFLSDDSLLLFEFDEDYPYVNETRELIRELYGTLGVEKAYFHILQFISDDYMNLLEEEYRFKKNRLVDAGFVDYFEALKIENTHINFDVMVNRLKKHGDLKADLAAFSKNQTLHKAALVPFKEGTTDIEEEMNLVEDKARLEFLQFNFIRLINGTLSSRDALKGGSVELGRVGESTKAKLSLGLSFLKDYMIQKGHLSFVNEESLFESFDFGEIYKIGNSLLSWEIKRVNKALGKNDLADEDSFLGRWFNDYIEHLFNTPVKVGTPDGKSQNVKDWKQFLELKSMGDTFCEMAPFIIQMLKTFDNLKESGSLNDHFYLNYSVSDIDFESILISSFANHFLGNNQKTNAPKLGLTLEEYKSFALSLSEGEEFKKSEQLDDSILNFIRDYGMEEVTGVSEYLYLLLKSQMEGYDWKHLPDQDYAHVGGPIILNLN